MKEDWEGEFVLSFLRIRQYTSGNLDLDPSGPHQLPIKAWIEYAPYVMVPLLGTAQNGQWKQSKSHEDWTTKKNEGKGEESI